MRLNGDIHIGEANPWAGQSTRRITGAPWPALLGNLAAALVMVAAVFLYGALNAVGYAPDAGWLPLLIVAGIAATIIGTRLCRFLMLRNFKKRLAERETPNPLPVDIEINTDTLRIAIGGIDHRIKWNAVSEVLEIGPYWVVLAEATPFFIPKRFFGDEQQERTFVTALMQRMSSPARARSTEANEFANGGERARTSASR